MKPTSELNKSNPLHLTGQQVSDTIARSALSRQEFAGQVGCGSSQLFKYQKEGLPPRMNAVVRARILEQAVELGVITANAALRAGIAKLLKGNGESHQNDARS
jgi:hypothetical protein